MQMSQEEYENLINSISNDEVAEVMYGVLFKIHMKLEEMVPQMSLADQWRYGLFKSFFKLYNTTLRLSEGVSYVFRDEISYIDIKAINTQIRACHELYLLFQYLIVTSISENDPGEKEFKYQCYRLSGALDNKRTYERIKNIPNYKQLYDEQIGHVRAEISECRKYITSSPIYQLLSPQVKDEVRNGTWRIDREKKLSWNDLLQYTPMPREYGVFEYHLLSMYAHTSHTALILEAQHDYNMIGALSHLYKLSALVSLTTLNAFGLDFDILEKREVALIIDLRNMGNNLMSGQGKN
ncbi:DUF5677 domain-containing protein [Pseudomonas putida]|uniref:DUF5677 domain-containing protein n=1 Tax=Pseudomonas putida TaxID=303 RepID=UPI0011B2533D|nr:DUF5677 domain-containing protein [Pseudomonas putida]